MSKEKVDLYEELSDDAIRFILTGKKRDAIRITLTVDRNQELIVEIEANESTNIEAFLDWWGDQTILDLITTAWSQITDEDLALIETNGYDLQTAGIFILMFSYLFDDAGQFCWSCRVNGSPNLSQTSLETFGTVFGEALHGPLLTAFDGWLIAREEAQM